MKATIFIIILICLSISASNAQGKLLNPARPFSIELINQSTGSSETIRIKLREVDIEEKPDSVSFDDVVITACSATDNDGKKHVGAVDWTAPEGTCTFVKGDSGLKPNWSTLKPLILYTYKDSNGVTKSGRYLVDPAFSSCVKTSEISATISPETVRMSADRIEVKLSLNADLRVRVSLKRGTTTFATQMSDELWLSRGSALKPVALKKVADPGVILTDGVFSLEVLAFDPDVKIANNVGNVSVKKFVPFQVKDIASVKVNVADNGKAKLKFGTTANGSIQAFLDGNLLKQIDNSNDFEFDFEAGALKEGAHSITLKGTSADSAPLEGDPTFPFVHQPRIFLNSSTITFSLDDNADVLRIRYQLTKQIENRWQFLDKDNNPGLGKAAKFVSGSSNEYEVEIDLRTQDTDFMRILNAELKGEGNKKASIVVQILPQNVNSPIGAFKIDFLKPDENLVKEIRAVIEKIRKGDQSTPKNDLKRLLGQDLADPVFKLIKSEMPPEGDGSKKLIYKVLGFAGKFVAGYFGVPLPI